MTSLESSCRNSVVDVEVRGGVDLADYAEHLSRTPLRCGVASGTAPDTVALAFAEERTWRYVSALVGLPAPGRLRIEVTAASKDVRAVADQVCRILSLDVDGSGFPMVVAGDPVLARRVRAGPGLRPALFCSPYEAACWAVVCHRLRLTQTDALVRRIAERRGRTLRVGGREVVCFPAPRDLRGLDSSYGLSGVKRRRLEAVAEAALVGELDASRLWELPADEAVERVRELSGIGLFSAELVGAAARDSPISSRRPSPTSWRRYGGTTTPTTRECWRRRSDGGRTAGGRRSSSGRCQSTNSSAPSPAREHGGVGGSAGRLW